MKYVRLIITVSFGLALMLSYQNCGSVSSPMMFSEKSSEQSTTDNSGGNGHPYDGKVYVLLTNSCSDGTRIQGKIQFLNSTASLVRQDCKDIEPIELNPSEYSIDINDPMKLYFQNQTYVIIGTPMDMKLVSHENGYSYQTNFDFGTPSNSPQNGSYISRLQIYEDGKAIGPAHEDYDDIRMVGGGKYNYLEGVLHFSTSDNSNPLTNGRLYTYEILNQPAPLPPYTITSIQTSSDANNIYFQYNYTGSIQHHRLFLNTDQNSSTGYIGRIGIGADYIIEDGSFRRYSGSNGAWGWTVIRVYPVSATSNSMRITLPKSEISSPRSIQFVFEIAGQGGGAKSFVFDQNL